MEGGHRNKVFVIVWFASLEGAPCGLIIGKVDVCSAC